MCRDLCIGNGFVDTYLYLVRDFLHIRFGIHKGVMGGSRYVIYYSMGRNTGVIEGFFLLSL